MTVVLIDGLIINW